MCVLYLYSAICHLFLALIRDKVLIILIILYFSHFSESVLGLLLLSVRSDYRRLLLLVDVSQFLINHLNVLHGLSHLRFEVRRMTGEHSLLQTLFVPVVAVVPCIFVKQFFNFGLHCLGLRCCIVS